MGSNQSLPVRNDGQFAGFAAFSEPVRARRDVTVFIALDALEDRRRARIAGFLEAGDGRGRDVKTARLQNHRNHRQPGKHIVRRLPGGLPQAVMRRQRAIA